VSGFFAAALSELGSLPLLELLALVLGIAYLVLAIRESIWCWLCAFVSSSIFAVLFADARIYMDSGLQVFYAAMAVYGACSWRFGDRRGRSAGDGLAVTVWPAARHLLAISAVLIASLLAGRALQLWTDAVYPYVDSFTTFASLWATFLVARKVLENWWYWLVIDAISVGIYIERGLEFAALLFAVYLVVIPFGLVAWTRSWRESGLHRAAS